MTSRIEAPETLTVYACAGCGAYEFSADEIMHHSERCPGRREATLIAAHVFKRASEVDAFGRPYPLMPEPLVGADRMAAMLDTSPATISRMREEGMPSVRWGKKLVRYAPSACMAWLLEQSERAQ